MTTACLTSEFVLLIIKIHQLIYTYRILIFQTCHLSPHIKLLNHIHPQNAENKISLENDLSKGYICSVYFHTLLPVCLQCSIQPEQKPTGTLRRVCPMLFHLSLQVTAGLLQPGTSAEVTKASLQVEKALKNRTLLSEAIGALLFSKLKMILLLLWLLARTS